MNVTTNHHPATFRLIILGRDEYYVANKAATRYGNSFLIPCPGFQRLWYRFQYSSSRQTGRLPMTLKALSSVE